MRFLKWVKLDLIHVYVAYIASHLPGPWASLYPLPPACVHCVHCADGGQCTVSVHSTVGVRSTVYSVQCTLYSVQGQESCHTL